MKKFLKILFLAIVMLCLTAVLNAATESSSNPSDRLSITRDLFKAAVRKKAIWARPELLAKIEALTPEQINDDIFFMEIEINRVDRQEDEVFIWIHNKKTNSTRYFVRHNDCHIFYLRQVHISEDPSQITEPQFQNLTSFVPKGGPRNYDYEKGLIEKYGEENGELLIVRALKYKPARAKSFVSDYKDAKRRAEEAAAAKAARDAAEQEAARIERERVAAEQEAARIERERVAAEQEAARLERERVASEQEAARLERERVASEQEAARLERERVAAEQEAAAAEAREAVEESDSKGGLNLDELLKQGEPTEYLSTKYSFYFILLSAALTAGGFGKYYHDEYLAYKKDKKAAEAENNPFPPFPEYFKKRFFKTFKISKAIGTFGLTSFFAVGLFRIISSFQQD